VGIYFAWLGFYTKMLLWHEWVPGPALVGLATEFYMLSDGGTGGGGGGFEAQATPGWLVGGGGGGRSVSSVILAACAGSVCLWTVLFDKGWAMEQVPPRFMKRIPFQCTSL
jgi:hypothetical protein